MYFSDIATELPPLFIVRARDNIILCSKGVLITVNVILNVNILMLDNFLCYVKC